MTERLIKFFEFDYSIAQRIVAYDYIENFISHSVDNWSDQLNTDEIAQNFHDEIKTFNNSNFAFLLMTTGYIPEFYNHDSKQETLYSKMVEVLVCEWGIRIGFIDSSIIKQKSSKEDVSLRLKELVIVCDAKTFRLGRSQAAPNVKDTIKKADYDKWKQFYRDKDFDQNLPYKTIGGLITFPSLHRWKKASDVILCCTDKEEPIIILYYEYMAFMLLCEYKHEALINTMENYPVLFPTKTRDVHVYSETIAKSLFGENDDFIDFIKLSIEIMNELVLHKKNLAVDFVNESSKQIKLEISKSTIEEFEQIKQQLIDSKIQIISQQLSKQIKNIDKFRLGIKSTTEEE